MKTHNVVLHAGEVSKRRLVATKLQAVGPLGYYIYELPQEDLLKKELDSLIGRPYGIAMPYASLSNTSNFLAMVSGFIEVRIGSPPSKFQIDDEVDVQLKVFYPLYGATKLYLSEADEELLRVSYKSFVGYYYVTVNPLVATAAERLSKEDHIYGSLSNVQGVYGIDLSRVESRFAVIVDAARKLNEECNDLLRRGYCCMNARDGLMEVAREVGVELVSSVGDLVTFKNSPSIPRMLRGEELKLLILENYNRRRLGLKYIWRGEGGNSSSPRRITITKRTCHTEVTYDSFSDLCEFLTKY